jgi:type VI secretion system secreted protein VgrG
MPAFIDAIAATVGSTERGTYELWVGPYRGRELFVATVRGRERLSQAYTFDVQVLAPARVDLLEAGLLGAPATLVMNLGEPARAVQGVILSVRPESRSAAGERRSFRLRIVPRLALAKLRATSRVFQGLTVPEIAKELFDAAGLPSRFALEGQYAKREYCVQYQETDYAFLTRILAEEGIFFFFEQPEALPGTDPSKLSEIIVVADRAQHYADADDLHLELRNRGHAGMVDARELRWFDVEQRLASDAVLVRDYDFERPLFNPRAEAGVEDSTDAAPPPSIGPRIDARWGEAHPLGIYDHRREHPDAAPDQARADVRLEQLRARARVASGASTCPLLAPGKRFFVDPFEASQQAGEFVVVGVDHFGHAPEVVEQAHTSGEARTPETYTNELRCVPASVPARPKRPKRRPRATLETAIVVGPEGEEIHADEYGRVRVQFHWDVRGSEDERSSCWVRCVESWAGSSWGTQFIPRVGMEAIVSFLGGDPDRPVVVGCSYNATRPRPFPLPLAKTRSGIRTQSTPGGNGSNELSFEDKYGSEQIYLHAQRDFDEVVDGNHTTNVLGNEENAVVGSRGTKVDRDDSITIGGDETRTVMGEKHETVEGNRVEHIGQSADFTVKGGLASQLGLERREVATTSTLTVGDDYTVRTRGCYTTIVGRNEAKRSYVLRVEGTAQISTSHVVEIDAEKSITLRCGKSFFKISEEKIEMWAPSVSVRGEGGGVVADENVTLRSKEEIALVSEKRVLLKTPDTSLGMKSEVQIDGKQILLNSPDRANDPVKDESPPPTRVALKDQFGKPLAYKRFLITLDDGTEYSGILDRDGATEIPIEGSGKITFPDFAGEG